MRFVALVGLAACKGTPDPEFTDAGALDDLGAPTATGDLVVSAEAPEGAILEIAFYEAPLAQSAGQASPTTFTWPLELDAWGSVVFTVEDRVYEGVDGYVLLEVTLGDPTVVDVFLEGAVLLGDAGAVAVPVLSWVDVSVE